MIDERELAELRSEVKDLRDENERLLHKIDQQSEGIADACELLGHEGNTPEDLTDALGQIERLLRGEDLADPLEGIAGKIQQLKIMSSG